MRIPIQYALTYPKRVPGVVPELDFTTLKLLTFDVADEETFRCLAACKKAIRKGGLGPCAANGATIRWQTYTSATAWRAHSCGHTCNALSAIYALALFL